MNNKNELFIRALRETPNIIIVGEAHDGNATELLKAITSAHEGLLTTIHCSSLAFEEFYNKTKQQ